MEPIAVQVSFKFILSNKLYFINDQFKLLFFLNRVHPPYQLPPSGIPKSKPENDRIKKPLS